MVNNRPKKIEFIFLITIISIVISLLQIAPVRGQSFADLTQTPGIDTSLTPSPGTETAVPTLAFSMTPDLTGTAAPIQTQGIPGTAVTGQPTLEPVDYDPGTPLVLSTDIYINKTSQFPFTLNPAQGYLLRVPVRDLESIGQLDNVIIKFWFDRSGTAHNGADFDSVEENINEYFEINWTRDTNKVTSWSNGSYWHLAGAEIPTDADLIDPELTNFTFEFTIYIGKTAPETLPNEKWQYAAYAVDQRNLSTYLPYSRQGIYGFPMNWYGEVTVPDETLNWGSVHPGLDFAEPRAAACLTKNVLFISNGSYFPAAKAGTTWTSDNLNSLSLRQNPVGPDTFALRVFRGTVLQPGTNGYPLNELGTPVDFMTGGTRTTDSGIAYKNLCFYLSISPDVSTLGIFTGTISFVIHN